MASVDPKTKTTYANTDWDQYRQGRPPYPPSLTELTYSYRRQHPNVGWERLVDVGAGSGIASTNFMPDFSIIHNSDPSPGNEDQARAFLPNWAQRHNLATTFEYTQSGGEEAHTKTGEQSADMVICATAAHFIDPDGLAASIAKMLRPGGTLAVFSYWMPSFPGRSQHFHDVFAKYYDNLVLEPLQSGDDLTRTRLSKVIQRRMAGKGVLDSLPIPEEFYDDPLRVYINAGSTGEIPYNSLFDKFAPVDPQPGGIARVSARDRIVTYHTGTDAEAEGWGFDADKKWLSIFLDTIRPADKKLSEEESREAYKEWDKIFDEECPNGTLRVLWPAYVVLATRK